MSIHKNFNKKNLIMKCKTRVLHHQIEFPIGILVHHPKSQISIDFEDLILFNSFSFFTNSSWRLFQLEILNFMINTKPARNTQFYDLHKTSQQKLVLVVLIHFWGKLDLIIKLLVTICVQEISIFLKLLPIILKIILNIWWRNIGIGRKIYTWSLLI